MRQDKKKALQLRRSGISYQEIRKTLNIPKGTLCDWLRGLRWSEKIKKELERKNRTERAVRMRVLDKIKGRYLEQIYQEAREEAGREFKDLKLYPLFILGVVIYWGEGDKTSRHTLKIANTDPLMIKCFLAFLVSICGVPREKIKAWLLLYPYLDENACKRFWIRQAGLSKRDFTKSIIIHGKNKRRKIGYGVCSLVASSTYLKEKMKIWLDLMPRELLKKAYFLSARV